MVVMVEEPRPSARPVDAIGGIHCQKCDKPLVKLVMKRGATFSLPAVLFKLCKCGEYNVIDLERGG